MAGYVFGLEAALRSCSKHGLRSKGRLQSTKKQANSPGCTLTSLQ